MSAEVCLKILTACTYGHMLILQVQMYHSYPPGRNTSTKAILYITDIFGVPLPQNQLLADSIASNDYLVVMPDLFAGDAISVEEQEAGLNLTEWRALHPTPEIDRIINATIAYMRDELEVEKIGGVGYCFGGKYVPRFLTASGGIDIGFVAHPSGLTEGEITAIENPLSIAAGSKSSSSSQFDLEIVKQVLIWKQHLTRRSMRRQSLARKASSTRKT